jgi:hypothetical protein
VVSRRVPSRSTMVHVGNRARARAVVQIRTYRIDDASKRFNMLTTHGDESGADQNNRGIKSASIGQLLNAGSNVVSRQRVRLK